MSGSSPKLSWSFAMCYILEFRDASTTRKLKRYIHLTSAPDTILTKHQQPLAKKMKASL